MKKTIVWIIGSTIACILVMLFALLRGSVSISFAHVLNILFHSEQSVYSHIIWDIRLPRIILAGIVGGGLSLAGVVLQGIFRNPLVEPYTLGVSGGAACAVVGVSVLFLPFAISPYMYPFIGFIGSVCIMVLLYVMNKNQRGFSLSQLLLSGIMISFLASSCILLILSLAKRDDMYSAMFWLMGSLEQSNWYLISGLGSVVLLFLIISQLMSMKLNILALGEQESTYLGLNVNTVKILAFVIAAIITGMCVSITGMIGFVGLVVPHCVRRIVGKDHRILIPCAFLWGAGFLILCDTLARTVIAPIQLPVGVVTGLIGGSVFLGVLIKK